MNLERRAANVSTVECTEIEREDTQTVLNETALQWIHGSTGSEKSVNQKDRRAVVVDVFEGHRMPKSISSGEMSEVGETVLPAR